MIGRETRMLLRHYLAQGMTKSALARQLGISRVRVHRWIRGGELDRDLGAEPLRPKVPPRPSKLDPYKPLILARLKAFPELSAVRLFEEVKAAGYLAGYDPVKCYVRAVRPRPEPEPVVRFKTPPAHQAQEDFAEFKFPWGKRLELTPIGGHPISYGEKGVYHAENETAVPGGVPGADRGAGSRRANACGAGARV